MDHREERQTNFLDFLGVDSDHPSIRDSQGIYYTRDFWTSNGGIHVKVYFLDTRTFRDMHFIRSVGEFNWPFSALVSAFIRLTLASLGIGERHGGDMLGSRQWKWLETSLSTSSADVNIIVSSIQVSTTNPVVESWGHFPIAKDRLFTLFQKYDPSGLLLLSGDVHHAEISEIHFKRADGTSGKWFEITSSGLTHTCRDSLLTRYICPLMLNTYKDHRAGHSNYFMERNFGLLNISGYGKLNMSQPCRAVINASVLSLDSDSYLEQLLCVPIRNTDDIGINTSRAITDVQKIKFHKMLNYSSTQLVLFCITIICVIIILLQLVKKSTQRRPRGKAGKFKKVN